MNALKKSQSEGEFMKFVLAVNLQVPGREHYSVVSYFSTDELVASHSLLEQFIISDDSFRNSQFKMVNRIVKGLWIVKTTAGNYSACLLGKALTCSYHRGKHY